MGKQDYWNRHFFSHNDVFANAFNYLFYREGLTLRIDPRELQDINGMQEAFVYGNGAVIPLQRVRDVVKVWRGNLLILGIEIQTNVHYMMPVRVMTYDALTYGLQGSEAANTLKKGDGAEIVVSEDGKVTLNLSNSEFLSGFRKTDRLIPVITAVIYMGKETWDGPLSLQPMLNVNEPELPS